MWSPRDLPDAPTRNEMIVGAVRAAIAAGDLVPGERLPTVRALAETLGLATNTVAKAYRELEAAGLIETRGRGGTVVAHPDVANSLKVAAAGYIARARALGVTSSEAVRAVEEAWPRTTK